ncbi:MAG: DHH family phosphoesterase [Tissierellia bacterium]|nr:DHH family phosphoesterase [Tissierellia bacterium]
MNKNKFTIKDLQVYLIFGVGVVLALLTQSKFLGAIFLVFYVFVVYFALNQVRQIDDYLTQRIEDLKLDFDKATEHAIFNMPFPLVITTCQGQVVWYNTPFLKLFEDEKILDEDLGKVVPALKDVDLRQTQDKDSLSIKLGDQYYRVHANVVDTTTTSSEEDRLIMLYWVNDSKYEDLMEVYQREKSIVLLVEIDNYDEVMDGTPTNVRPIIQSQVDQILNQYFHDKEALVNKYDDESYLVVLNQHNLEICRQDRFSILDTARAIDVGNTLSLTLSIGASSGDLPFKKAYEEAEACLNVALGRGGDQAVLRKENNYEFFGGESKAVEKSNKVKARVLGNALKQLVEKSETIYVMGHTNPDMDAIGSAIGVLRVAENCQRPAHLVLNQSNPSISTLVTRMKEEAPDHYEGILSGEEALEKIKDSDLLILVDNHKPSFTIHPDLVAAAKNIVVVDHHRRGSEFVANPVLVYVEPYASSTSELITEMLSYMGNDTRLTPFEADALMSGIVVDTKNFTFQTGVRTFEAASLLKRAGADMGRVRKLFEDDFETITMKSEVIHKSKIVFDHIAIGRLVQEAENSVLVAAQAADDLLHIYGIRASFVLTKHNGKIHISGRSFEDISVQLILEKLGGGGHLNMAGAQLDVATIDEAEEALMGAIEEYMEEGEKKK